MRLAMDIAGYAKTTKTAEVVGPLKEEIIERAIYYACPKCSKAAFGIFDVLDDPGALGARLRIQLQRPVKC